MNKIIKELKEALNTDTKTKAYDTQAKVVRSEGQTVWVHIPGGVDETPVKRTINAKVGDTVQVRVGGGSAWLVGNQSAPPTDDTRAIVAETTAITANENANIAAQAANSAVESAERASSAATRAEASAKTAESQAVSATKSANNALTQLSTVESVVDTLTWIAEHSTFIPTTDTTVQSGKTYYLPSNQTLELVSGVTETNGVTFTVDADAGTVTVNGTASAIIVFPLGQPDVTAGDTIYLSGCVGGSSGTYGLRYSNGPGSVTIYDGETAKATARSSGNLNCNIYVNTGTEMDNVVFNPRVSTENDGYEYEIVENPTGNPSTQGYYELDTSEAVKTYVKSHLSLTNDGLYVLNDASGWKVLIKNTGVEIQNPSGGKVAEYSSTILLGLVTETHTTLSAEGMKIYAADGTTQIAHLGYGEGTAQSGTDTAPYYTLGTRELGSKVASAYSSSSTYSVGALCKYNGETYVCRNAITTPEAWNSNHWQPLIGNYSIAEGEYVIASGGNSYAEGRYTAANGYCSHAEGGPKGSPIDGPVANGDASHAEGISTRANGTAAHAQNRNTEANGENSHAQNVGTIANGESQTALGKYNVADTTSAVIIGNGTSSARSNALTINWNGDVNLKGQAKTSFKSSVAMGSYGSSQTTVPNLVEEVRFSSGCCGSVSIGTAYTANNVTIATGWYNFMYMPHRSGGVNGSASGDNCNYGNLFLFGMNNTNGRFVVRVSSGAIAEVAQIYTSIERYTRSNAGDLAWSSQADGDAKVIMKSALAFWNGAYNGTGSNLKYSNNGEILGKNIVKDWATAHGTSGNWTYRKWNSGQIEAWYSGSLALTNDGQLSSASPTWYRSHYAVTVPSAVGMTTIKTANCSNTSPASFHMQANTAISGLTITQYCIRGGGTLTGNVTANIYVTGV